MTAPTAPDKSPLPPAHLFCHSLREGRVHPLLHVVQRYRQETPR
jgi:hypothetical protein